MGPRIESISRGCSNLKTKAPERQQEAETGSQMLVPAKDKNAKWKYHARGESEHVDLRKHKLSQGASETLLIGKGGHAG